MKRKISLFLLFPLALLASCSSANKRTPLVRNGDILLSSETTYLGICIQQSVERMMARMDDGETVAFLFSSLNCSHCLAWEPTFVSFLSQENYEVVLYQNGTMLDSEWKRSVAAIQTYFHDTETIRMATPLLFIGDKQSFSFAGTSDTSQERLHSNFKAQGDGGHITSFRSIEAYQRYLATTPDALIYLYDSASSNVGHTFYVDCLFPAAKSSSKPLALLDFQGMNSTNQTTALTLFGLSAFTPILKQKESVYNLAKESEVASATSLVQKYYR
ncbi:MAG: hypothetical protein WCS90_03645 [Bacilli bacterium]